MTVTEYISKQDPERQELLSSIHQIILDTDKKISGNMGQCMGKDMILYTRTTNTPFMYALASVKNYMSLHVMPLYGSKPLHEKYSKLLPNAKIQKACINFQNESELPLDIVKQLFRECSKIDWKALLEKYQKNK